MKEVLKILTSCCAIAALLQNAIVTASEDSFPLLICSKSSIALNSAVILISSSVRMPQVAGTSIRFFFSVVRQLAGILQSAGIALSLSACLVLQSSNHPGFFLRTLHWMFRPLGGFEALQMQLGPWRPSSIGIKWSYLRLDSQTRVLLFYSPQNCNHYIAFKNPN